MQQTLAGAVCATGHQKLWHDLDSGLELIKAEFKLHILLIHTPLKSFSLPTHACQDLSLLTPA